MKRRREKEREKERKREAKRERALDFDVLFAQVKYWIRVSSAASLQRDEQGFIELPMHWTHHQACTVCVRLCVYCGRNDKYALENKQRPTSSGK